MSCFIVKARIFAGRSLDYPSVSGQVTVFEAVAIRQRLLCVRTSPRQAESQSEHQKRIKMFHKYVILNYYNSEQKFKTINFKALNINTLILLAATNINK